LDEAHCLVQNIESFCSQQRFYPLVASRIHQLVTVQNLVALGLGLSFIPKMACGEDCGGKLVYRALSGPKPTRMIAACFNPLRYQSQLLQNVIKAIRELLSTEDFSAVSRQTNRARHCAQKPS
jgi:LysR family hydrogen peroxide-inducible transcriptional activator